MRMSFHEGPAVQDLLNVKGEESGERNLKPEDLNALEQEPNSVDSKLIKALEQLFSRNQQEDGAGTRSTSSGQTAFDKILRSKVLDGYHEKLSLDEIAGSSQREGMVTWFDEFMRKCEAVIPGLQRMNTYLQKIQPYVQDFHAETRNDHPAGN